MIVSSRKIPIDHEWYKEGDCYGCRKMSNLKKQLRRIDRFMDMIFELSGTIRS